MPQENAPGKRPRKTPQENVPGKRPSEIATEIEPQSLGGVGGARMVRTRERVGYVECVEGSAGHMG